MRINAMGIAKLRPLLLIVRKMRKRESGGRGEWQVARLSSCEICEAANRQNLLEMQDYLSDFLL